MSLDLVKRLREEIGVGIVDCKNALSEAGNDYEKAVEILRKKSASSVQKKASRAVSEGFVGVIASNDFAAIVTLRCETDFVSRNEKFQDVLSTILQSAISSKSETVDSLLSNIVNGVTIQEMISSSIAAIGENIVLSDLIAFKLTSNESFAYYIHSAVAGKSMGRIVSFVIADQACNEEQAACLKQIAMHAAATNPIALDEQSVSKDTLDKEMEIYTAQAAASGKPEQIAVKIAEGRLQKFKQENILIEQQFVVDMAKTVKDVLKENGIAKLKKFGRISI